MSGIGETHPTWQALRQAFEAHAKEAYGDEYVLQDFVMIGYVISMEDDSDEAEYVMATSSQIPHIVEGLVAQCELFQGTDDD